MAKFVTQLIGRREVAEGTMAFYFKKPENFSYIAGQHILLALSIPARLTRKGIGGFFPWQALQKNLI